MENTANLWLFVVHKIVSEYTERIYREDARGHKTEDILVIYG